MAARASANMEAMRGATERTVHRPRRPSTITGSRMGRSIAPEEVSHPPPTAAVDTTPAAVPEAGALAAARMEGAMAPPATFPPANAGPAVGPQLAFEGDPSTSAATMRRPMSMQRALQ